MSSPEKFYIYDPKTKEMTFAGTEAPEQVSKGKVLIPCNEPVRGVLARHEAEIAELRSLLADALSRLNKAGL